MRRGFKSSCEQRASAFRQELGLKEHDPLPADLLAAHLSVLICGPTNIPDLAAQHKNHLLQEGKECWSAVTITTDDHILVVSNPTHSAARREANIMHELAHVVLKHRPAQIVTVPGFPFPIREYQDDVEDEATWLGGVLQLPRIALEWALIQRMSQQQICQHFTASAEMVRFRRNITGVDRQYSKKRKL